MFCCINYSIPARKWSVTFYDSEGHRNNREAEYFDQEIEANNRVSELMVDEGIRFVRRPLEERLKFAIFSMLHSYEDTSTYTDCEEYRKEGAIGVLEDLASMFDLH